MKSDLLRNDDIFLMGNIAIRSVMSGKIENIDEFTRILRRERPQNAGGVLIDALKLLNQGDKKKAISELEDADIFRATENRDEAILVYLSLLVDDGQNERAEALAASILDQDIEMAPRAREALGHFVLIAKMSDKEMK